MVKNEADFFGRKASIFICLIVVFIISLLPKILPAQVPDSIFIDLQHDTIPVIDSSNVYVTLSDFDISGNKVTKEFIIRREIQIKKGDSISLKRVTEVVNRSQQLVYNTNLFAEVFLAPEIHLTVLLFYRLK